MSDHQPTDTPRVAPEFVETGSRRAASTSAPRSHRVASVPVNAPIEAAPPRVRKAKRPAQPRFALITALSALRGLLFTFTAALAVATIFMWWTSPDFLPAQARRDLAPVQATAQRVNQAPTTLPTPIWFNRVGILAGHSGLTTQGGGRRETPDSGAVCPDGFFERIVTEAVADRAAAILRGRGFTVDVLEEFDTRLQGYQASAFISLHADSCENFGYGGFKSTFPTERTIIRDRDTALNTCMIDNYRAVTGLEFTPGSITINMTQYHAFDKISVRTPANILELGFLSYDRDLLQNQPDRLGLAVANAVLCFLDAPSSTPTPGALVPTPTP
jgi:N-acetylmuramoyl-L-alanine amidase